MAEIAFVVNVPKYSTSGLGNFLKAGRELVRQVAKDLPLESPGSVTLLEVLVSDKHLVPDVYANWKTPPAVGNPTVAPVGKVTTTNLTVVGGAAGNLTVAGILTTDTLKSVVSIDDTTHAATDLMTGANPMTITATNTINNTGGTASTGGHVVVTWDRT